MNECSHKINKFASIICSDAFKFRCEKCSEKVVREHWRTEALAELIMLPPGIILIALLVLSFIWLPWVAASVAGLFAVTFLWDLYKNPIKTQSEEELKTERVRNKRAAIALIVFGLCVVGFIIHLVINAT